MSQTDLQPPTPSAGPATALAVVEPQRAERKPYQPEPLRKTPLFWRMVKWPIRQVLKVIYVVGSAVARHRGFALVTFLVLLVGGSVVTYLVPAARPGNYIPIQPLAIGQPGQAGGQNGAGAAPAGQGTSASSDTPFTVEVSAQPLPPLPAGVIKFLHAYKTFNGQEEWDSLAASVHTQLQQQGAGAKDLQSQLDQLKAQGISFEQFVYTGGYMLPDGSSDYIIRAIYNQGGQRGLRTWYLVADPTGLVIGYQDLSPA